MLKIFNTLTRQKEEFKPIHAGVMNCFFLVNHGALTGHVSVSSTDGGDVAFASETQTLTDSEAR
ncbi:hypothetical protein KU710_22785, partial [Salmonella enterica subsp. enterica serovar Give]|nr:hypothetical protein [Salmonella enterica subsp. enterica serovar Give]